MHITTDHLSPVRITAHKGHTKSKTDNIESERATIMMNKRNMQVQCASTDEEQRAHIEHVEYKPC